MPWEEVRHVHQVRRAFVGKVVVFSGCSKGRITQVDEVNWYLQFLSF